MSFMYEIDFTHPGKIHFIGIGGISMSGFAELLHSMGFTITGSDWHESKITKHLESLGIQVVYGQKEENITKDIDLVVYTAAVKKTNPEYQAAEKLNLPLMERAVMVGQVMKNYSSAIAIAGTHGKTTTTSIASHIFLAANLDPTISVGGILEAIGGNIRIIGTKPDGSGWNTGIRDPQDPDGSFAVSLDLSDTACVTSGTYERYYMVDGEKYHHIIDKDTLYPADYFESLTVVTKDSGLADALSTALFCMSYEDGLALAEKLGVDVLWIFPDGGIRYTSGLEARIVK